MYVGNGSACRTSCPSPPPTACRARSYHAPDPARVAWIRSYATADKTRTFCVYEAPSPAAVRAAAERNGIPVDEVLPIPRDLDPGPVPEMGARFSLARLIAGAAVGKAPTMPANPDLDAKPEVVAELVKHIRSLGQ